jgi:dihydrofolate reductase
MANVIIYCAVSLDGFLAGPNDDLSFLDAMHVEGEDYGYNALKDRVDTVIMARKTYDVVCGFGVPFPHADKTCFVLSNSRQGGDDEVFYVNGDALRQLLQTKRTSDGGLGVFADGGAELFQWLIREKLADELILSVVPVLIGEGTRLFTSAPAGLKLQNSQAFPSGLVQLTYTFTT